MIDCKEAPPSEWTQFYSNVYSQFGEDGVLAEIFKRIGTTNKQCFECGAADGKWFSNSRRLIDEGWSAALIEGEPANWPELDKLDNPPRVNVVHGLATPSGPDSLDSILAQCGFNPSMDLGVIDIDGQDYYLWNGMLKYVPRVMVVEYDPFADKNFVPDLNGAGQAGLAAICSIAVSKGYFNAATTRTNLIFVRNDCKEKFYAPIRHPDSAEKRIANGQVPVPPTIEGNPVFASDVAASKIGEAVQASRQAPPAVIATDKAQEIKIAAILSRPRFGLSVFFDCAAEALAPWGIPLQSSYGVFWEQIIETMISSNIDRGVEWILTLDFDTLFTSRHVQQLIDVMSQNPHVDAVAALQCRRGRPSPLAVRADGTMPLDGKPVQVRTAHFGLTLFRASSFKKLKKKPWFRSQPAPDGSWGEGRLDPDIYFWGNWGDSGNNIFVQTACRVGHVEEMASEFDENGKVSHHYLSEWRKRNGHTIKSFE